jgi:hypothetical protein
LSRGFRVLGLIVAGIFAAIIIALQHRSVWVATIGGLVWLIVRSPRVVRREWLKLSCIVLFLASALSLAPIIASSRFEKGVKMVEANIGEAQQKESTWTWRVDGFSEATQRLFSSSLIDTAIGPPIGADLSDYASPASLTIHDQYVFMLVYYGVAGFAFQVLWLAFSAARIHLMDRHGDYRYRNVRFSKAILESLMVSIVIYFVPYNGEELEGLLLGAMWLATANHSKEEEKAAVGAGAAGLTLARSAS